MAGAVGQVRKNGVADPNPRYRRVAGIAAAGAVGVALVVALGVMPASAATLDGSGWTGQVSGNSTTTLATVELPAGGTLDAYFQGFVIHAGGVMTYGWYCQRVYAGGTLGLPVHVVGTITTNVWSFSGGVWSLGAVSYERYCKAVFNQTGDGVGAMISVFNWHETVPEPTVGPSVSNTPVPTSLWPGPTSAASCSSGGMGPSACPTAPGHWTGSWTFTCDTTPYWFCSSDDQSLPVGELVYVTYGSGSSLLDWPQIYNNQVDPGPAWIIGRGEESGLCGDFTALEVPVSGGSYCSDLAHWGVDSRMMATGSYWAVTSWGDAVGGHKDMQMHVTNVPEGMRGVQTAVVYDYGPYLPGEQLPICEDDCGAVPSAPPIQTYPPGPVPTDYSTGGYPPGNGGTGIPPGGPGGNCQPGPLSGVCKPGIGGYGAQQECNPDIFNVTGYLGCMIGNVGTAIANAARWLINAFIDLLVPDPHVIADMVNQAVATLQRHVPFSYVAQLVGWVSDAMGGVGGAAPSTITIGGQTLANPFVTGLSSLAPWRGFMAAGVWLLGVISILRLVMAAATGQSDPKQMELGL